ncbi:MAG: hypothetical protein E6G97_17990 [Alphaproteobacteria bacterium]|nr:MAG: hypothetical protein E6G97_17990 [Alphaproteobacteria bacterium]
MPTVPDQPYLFSLNPIKGWPNVAACDFVAKPSANVLYDLRAGQCCHLNASGELEPGVGTSNMAVWIFQGVNAYDVSTARPADYLWEPITPGGNIMCIPAKASMELETTEYVFSQTFAPNNLLKSPIGNTANDEGLSATRRPTTTSSGVLRNDAITLFTTAVVGVVSRGVRTNYNKRSMLGFWPVWGPGTA